MNIQKKIEEVTKKVQEEDNKTKKKNIPCDHRLEGTFEKKKMLGVEYYLCSECKGHFIKK